MPAVNEVPTVRVLPVDGQPQTGKQLNNPLGHQKWCRLVIFWRTEVRSTRHWQHCHVHRDRPVHVQQRHDEKYPPENYEPEKNARLVKFLKNKVVLLNRKQQFVTFARPLRRNYSVYQKNVYKKVCRKFNVLSVSLSTFSRKVLCKRDMSRKQTPCISKKLCICTPAHL